MREMEAEAYESARFACLTMSPGMGRAEWMKRRKNAIDIAGDDTALMMVDCRKFLEHNIGHPSEGRVRDALAYFRARDEILAEIAEDLSIRVD